MSGKIDGSGDKCPNSQQRLLFRTRGELRHLIRLRRELGSRQCISAINCRVWCDRVTLLSRCADSAKHEVNARDRG